MTNAPIAADSWASGEAYEHYVGRWSRRVAPLFVRWLEPAPQLAWADVGCGTGALSAAIVDAAQPRRVHGVDLSPAFVALARDRIADARVRFEVGDATRLPWADGTHDAAVSALVLNFVADAGAMVREMARVTRPGGSVALYVWDYGGGMQMMRRFWDVVTELNPAASGVDEALRFPICRPDALQALFEGAGLKAVATRAIEIATVFRDFDDYWQPFLGGTGAAPSYLARQHDGERARIRERLRERLGTGPIELTARAWAVRGAV